MVQREGQQGSRQRDRRESPKCSDGAKAQHLAKNKAAQAEPDEQREGVQAHRLPRTLAAERSDNSCEEGLRHGVAQGQDQHDYRGKDHGKVDDQKRGRESAEPEADGEQSRAAPAISRPADKRPGKYTPSQVKTPEWKIELTRT